MSHNRSGEPRLGAVASWVVLAASFGLSASTWIAIAVLAGFTSTVTVTPPDAGVSVTLRLAWLMPIAVDGYVVVALVLWMAPVPARVAAFARVNTYAAASVGIIAQSAYHALVIYSTTQVEWRAVLAALAGALPPAVAGLAVHMRALIRRESAVKTSAPTPPLPVAVPVPDAVPAVVPSVPTTPTTVPTPPPSSVDELPADPAPPAPSVTPVAVPSPAVLAQRITSPRPTTSPATPAMPAGAGTRSTRTRPSKPARPPAQRLAPSTTDFPVSASEAAQPTLPGIAPDLLARAAQVAREYRTDHGEPITPGKLAVRLKMTSEQAGHVLAAIDQNTDPTPVNGAAVKATR